MLVRADEARVAGKESFAEHAPADRAQAGTSNFYAAVYDILDGNEANPRIKLFDTFGASVQALKVGDVDMVLMDRASIDGYIGADPACSRRWAKRWARTSSASLTPGSDLTGPSTPRSPRCRPTVRSTASTCSGFTNTTRPSD